MASIALFPSIRSTAILVLIAALEGRAIGQSWIWSRDADKGQTGFGWTISSRPDFDSDGVVDLLVGEDNASCDGTGIGIVHVVGGISGAELDRFCGDAQSAGFGESACLLDDVDGDGASDLAFGAPYYDDVTLGHWTGEVTVVSSASHQIIYALVGEMGLSLFGRACASIADVDGDGQRDLLIGAPNYDDFTGRGRAYVYSGKSGSLLRTYDGSASYEAEGSNVAALGDVDGDGVGDYAIGASLGGSANNKGRVTVYGGVNGAELYHWLGADQSRLGTCIADGGDFDNDGHGDLLVSGFANSSGVVYAYSGANGSNAFELHGDGGVDAFGVACAVLGDLNGDGAREFLVGAPSDTHDGSSAGCAFLFSGSSRRPLYRFRPGYAGALLGWRVAATADSNGDRIPDGVIGVEMGRKTKGVYGPGWIFAFAGNDLFLQASDTTVSEGDTITIDTRGGEAGAFTLLVLTNVGGTPLFAPLVLSTLDANGESSIVADAPVGSSGLDFTLIAYAQKHAGGRGIIDSGTEMISVR